MPAPTISDHATARRTITLDKDADNYLSKMVPYRTGHGRFLSILLREDKLRRELTAQHQTAAPREPWEHRDHA